MKLPQLSVRDLFWLVLVCALVVGWWLNYRELQAATDQARVWRQEYELVRGRLDDCNSYLNKLDPNRDDYDQF